MATETPSHEAHAQAASPTIALRGKAVRVLILAAALTIFVVLLPSLASRTPLGGWLLNYAARKAKLNASISAGGLSLGWFSPVGAQNVEVRDVQGKLLLSVPQIAMDKTLWQLLNDRNRLGGIKLDRPTLELILRDDGSNVEDVLSAWLPLNVKEDVKRIDCAVEVVEGQVVIHDESARRDWKLEQFKLALQSPGPTSQPVKLILSGAMPATSPESSLNLTLRVGGGQAAEIKLAAHALPLAASQALLRRVAPGGQWSGQLDADLHYHAGAAADQQLLEGEAIVSQFALSGPWLGVDRLSLAQLELPCRLDWKGEHLTVEELGLVCDVGELECYASLADTGGLAQLDGFERILELLSRGDAEASGRLDLAKLAALLPGTLRIREGVELTAGDLQWKLTSRPMATGPRWQGKLSTTQLVALYDGKKLTWDQPLDLRFDAHHAAHGTVFDELVCHSDFFQFEGKGTLDSFHLSGTHDLAKLTDQLSRFVDLGGLQLAGDGATELDVRRTSEQEFQAEIQTQVNGWALVRPGEQPWTEPQIVGTANVAGLWSGAAPTRLDKARCELTAGRDRIVAVLGKPVELASPQAAWPIEWTLSGQLANWLARFQRQPKQPDDWQWSGECQGQGQIQYSAGSIAGNGQLTIDGFQARSPVHGAWNERQLRLVAQAVYDRKTDALQLDRAQLASAAIALDARGKIDKLSGERDAKLEGQATYDWAQVEGLLRTYTGDSLRVTGRQTRPFSLAGPLSALTADRQTAVTKLSGQAELGWQSATVFGALLGPGQTQAELARGAVRFSPLEIPLSGGKVHLEPTIELAGTPVELSLAPGRIVDQVQITPEMCNAGMKYALPILAEATEAQGRFSVTLDGCQLPLTNPGAGDAAGKILIHSVQVGPGPLTRAFVPVIQLLAEALGVKESVQPPAAVAITRESQVEYRMVQGRVYHRGLELAFPDAVVRTYGSVGFDQSLAVMAEMPVPSKWIGDNALGRSLRGQVIRLPIGGTLHQPKIDGSEIRRLTGRVLEDAARSTLQQELGRQLDRLFK